MDEQSGLLPFSRPSTAPNPQARSGGPITAPPQSSASRRPGREAPSSHLPNQQQVAGQVGRPHHCAFQTATDIPNHRSDGTIGGIATALRGFFGQTECLESSLCTSRLPAPLILQCWESGRVWSSFFTWEAPASVSHTCYGAGMEGELIASFLHFPPNSPELHHCLSSTAPGEHTAFLPLALQEALPHSSPVALPLSSHALIRPPLWLIGREKGLSRQCPSFLNNAKGGTSWKL